MNMTESSGKSGAAQSAAMLSPSQVAELQALLWSMDTWLSNDEGLMNEDVIEWREQLARALGVEPQSWFKRTVKMKRQAVRTEPRE